MIGPSHDPSYEPHRSEKIREIIVELVENHGGVTRAALHHCFSTVVYWNHPAYGYEPHRIEIDFQLDVLLGLVEPEPVKYQSWSDGWKKWEEWNEKRGQVP